VESDFGRPRLLDDVGELADPVEDLLRGDEDVGVAGVDRRSRRVDQTRLADPATLNLKVRQRIFGAASLLWSPFFRRIIRPIGVK